MSVRLASIPDAELMDLASGIESAYEDAKAAAQYHHMMRSRYAGHWRLQQRTTGQKWARWRNEIIRRKLWPAYYRKTRHANSRAN